MTAVVYSACRLTIIYPLSAMPYILEYLGSYLVYGFNTIRRHGVRRSAQSDNQAALLQPLTASHRDKCPLLH